VAAEIGPTVVQPQSSSRNPFQQPVPVTVNAVPAGNDPEKTWAVFQAKLELQLPALSPEARHTVDREGWTSPEQLSGLSVAVTASLAEPRRVLAGGDSVNVHAAGAESSVAMSCGRTVPGSVAAPDVAIDGTPTISAPMNTPHTRTNRIISTTSSSAQLGPLVAEYAWSLY
jgi:hypothetical protein